MISAAAGVVLLILGGFNPAFNGIDLLGWACLTTGGLWTLARSATG